MGYLWWYALITLNYKTILHNKKPPVRVVFCHTYEVKTIELATYRELAVKVDSLLSQCHVQCEPKTTGRPLSIPMKDAITLGIYWHVSGRNTKKSVYEDFKDKLHCTYKTVVCNINKYVYLIMFLVMKLLEMNRESSHMIKHIDGSIIPVCLTKNAKHHKTMKDYSAWSKSKTSWFYGLKLHMVSDLNRKILNVYFTPGNTDERSIVVDLIKELSGIFIEYFSVKI